MDPPPQSNIFNSMHQLWVLGAFDNVGDFTPVGHKMSEFPMELVLAKILVTSLEYRCSVETIISMLNAPSSHYQRYRKGFELTTIITIINYYNFIL